MHVTFVWPSIYHSQRMDALYEVPKGSVKVSMMKHGKEHDCTQPTYMYIPINITHWIVL